MGSIDMKETAMTAPLNLNSYRDDNLGALEISITEDQRARLDKVSATSLGFPHDLLRMPTIARSIGGGTELPARTW